MCVSSGSFHGGSYVADSRARLLELSLAAPSPGTSKLPVVVALPLSSPGGGAAGIAGKVDGSEDATGGFPSFARDGDAPAR